MHSVLSQHHGPGSVVPAFGVTPQSNPATSASYSANEKPDFRTYAEYPAEPTEHVNSFPQDGIRYPGKEEAQAEAPSTSLRDPTMESRMNLHKEPETMRIAPDGFDNHLPGQTKHASQNIKGGKWKYGLCDCGDISVCCAGAWCPCIVYGKTQYRLSRRSERNDPTNLLGYSAFNGSCAAFALLCGCNLILAAIQHSRVRKAYDIPGDIGTDVVRACCCCCCSLSQDEKEVKFRESQFWASSGSARAMQYASPQGMTFSAVLK